MRDLDGEVDELTDMCCAKGLDGGGNEVERWLGRASWIYRLCRVISCRL